MQPDEAQRWTISGIHAGDGGVPTWSVGCDTTRAAVDYLGHCLHESDAVTFVVRRVPQADTDTTPTQTSRAADITDAIIGAVENGPWVLIPDPQLRELVGEYIAETCHSIAVAAGLDEAMESAHNAMPTRLARALPATAESTSTEPVTGESPGDQPTGGTPRD